MSDKNAWYDRWLARLPNDRVLTRLLLESFREHRWKYLAAVVAMVLVALCTAASAWMMGQIIDTLSAPSSRLQVFSVGAGVAFIFIFRGAAMFAQVVLLPAPSCATHRSCFWTKPPVRSTATPKQALRRRSRRSRTSAPRSLSRTGSPQCWTQTKSAMLKAVKWSSAVALTSWWRWAVSSKTSLMPNIRIMTQASRTPSKPRTSPAVRAG